VRYLVYREELVGTVEAPSWGQASFHAVRQFGGRVTRVQVAAGVESDERTDRDRAQMSRRKVELNNDNEQDGA